MKLFSTRGCTVPDINRISVPEITDCTVIGAPEAPEPAPVDPQLMPIETPGCMKLRWSEDSKITQGSTAAGKLKLAVDAGNQDNCSPELNMQLTVPCPALSFTGEVISGTDLTVPGVVVEQEDGSDPCDRSFNFKITLPKVSYEASDSCVFRVKNSTGSTISPGDIMGLSSLDYSNKSAVGVTPTVDHASQYCVAIATIASGGYGSALVCGVVSGVTVEVRDNHSQGVMAVPGDTKKLQTGMYGGGAVTKISAKGTQTMSVELHMGGGTSNSIGKNGASSVVEDSMVYVIDRSDRTHDNRKWPINAASMVNYTAVKLILPFFLYDGSSTPKMAKQVLYWTSALAPVILPWTANDAPTTTCS
jgi:hypothetical protein